MTSTTVQFSPSSIDGAGFQNVIAISPLDPDKLLLGGDVAGINYSTDKGVNWTSGNEGLWKSEQLHVAVVAWSPTVRNKGYMSASWKGIGGGFFVTTDGGQSWEQRSTVPQCHGGLTSDAEPLPNPHPRSIGNLLVIDDESGFLYIATFKDGVMRSDDDGRTWTTIGFAGKYLRSLVIDPANLNTLYVAVYNEGVYAITKSQTTATSTKLAGTPTTPEELAVIGDVLWLAAGVNGVFKTTGSGAGRSFTKSSVPTSSAMSHYTIAGYVPITGKAIIYVGNFQGKKVGSNYENIYKSVDGGNTWASITSNPAGVSVIPWGGVESWWLSVSAPSFMLGKQSYVSSQIAIDPVVRDRIYSAGRSGVWRSDDAGATWQPAIRGIGTTITRSVSVTDSSQVFVSIGDYVMLQSTDGAYFLANRPPTGNFGYATAVDSRSTKPRVWVGAGERDTNTLGDLWRNDDPFGSGTWVSEGLGAVTTNKRVLGVTFLPDTVDGDVLLAAVDGAGVWRKANNSWTKVSSEISGTEQAGGATRKIVRGVAAGSNNVLYAYDPNRGVYRSKDVGKSWTKIWDKPTTGSFDGYMVSDPQAPGTLYVVPGDSVYRIDNADNGTVGNGLTAVNLKVTNPGPIIVSKDRTVWAIQQVTEGHPAQLLTSSNYGNDWAAVDDPVLRSTVATTTGIAVDDAGSKVYITLDGGGMLVGNVTVPPPPIPEPEPEPPVIDLVLHMNGKTYTGSTTLVES